MLISGIVCAYLCVTVRWDRTFGAPRSNVVQKITLWRATAKNCLLLYDRINVTVKTIVPGWFLLKWIHFSHRYFDVSRVSWKKKSFNLDKSLIQATNDFIDQRSFSTQVFRSLTCFWVVKLIGTPPSFSQHYLLDLNSQHHLSTISFFVMTCSPLILNDL